MSFAMSVPDWNSLDSVRRVHSDLEAAALVFFALLVLFDVLAHLSKDKPGEMLLEKIALVFFGLAVLAEIAAYPYGHRNDTLSGKIIVSLDAKAQEADVKAKEAVADASTALSLGKDALTKAAAAQRSLAVAEKDAKKAQTAASNALALADAARKQSNAARSQADAARKEADSFERDIVSAKEQAAKAESHLAEAMKRATALTAQLDRLTTPRSLPHSPQVIASLKPFKDTEYMFTKVCADTECVNLLRDIDTVLELAGWKRVKSPHTLPGLVLWGGPKSDDGAGIDLEPATVVSVESKIPERTNLHWRASRHTSARQ
jgi:hypothetical protein